MVVFCGTFVCTGKGYVERETSLALLKIGGYFFRAHLSKVVVFCGTFVCTVKGYVERETSLASLNRGGHFSRARFAHLSKVVVFCVKLGCTKMYPGQVQSCMEGWQPLVQKCT